MPKEKYRKNPGSFPAVLDTSTPNYFSTRSAKERLERSGPCWLLKLRQMETQEEYILKGSFLGWFVGLVVLVQEIFVLPWLLLSAQCKILYSFTYRYTISLPLSPSPSTPGRQSCCVTCLLICVSGSASCFSQTLTSYQLGDILQGYYFPSWTTIAEKKLRRQWRRRRDWSLDFPLLYIFGRARVFCPLLCLCRPFLYFWEMSGFEPRELP